MIAIDRGRPSRRVARRKRHDQEDPHDRIYEVADRRITRCGVAGAIAALAIDRAIAATSTPIGRS